MTETFLDYQATDFQNDLAQVAESVERTLASLLTIDSDNERENQVIEAMRQGALAGGKRLRPALTVGAARLFGFELEKVLVAASAIEMLHSYSLVHDDLPAMDNSPLRRGKPTVHVLYDEATAVLAGDGLLTKAFEILSAETAHPDPLVRCQLVAGLAKAAGERGMIGGQMLDMIAEETELSEAEVVRLQQKKTGALIAFSCEAGGLCAGANKRELASLKLYGANIGLAFQIVDDLLDLESTAEALGKPAGRDQEAGKLTLIDVYGLDAARAKAQMLVKEAQDAITWAGEKAGFLHRLAEFVLHRSY
ncbi:polyprenyl synthetase family protein [Alphaproteobacteria bacterium]|nr:polyprenyl synthetase family protein [Alphaproteobacteria bacterium]